MSRSKRDRDLKIHRLHRKGYSARQLGEAVGLSTRQVQRILPQMKQEYEDGLRRLHLQPEETDERGRARGLELLDLMKEMFDQLGDLLATHDLGAGTAMEIALGKSLFERHYLELQAMLHLLPDARGGKRDR